MPTAEVNRAAVERPPMGKTDTLAAQGIARHQYADAERIAANTWATREELESTGRISQLDKFEGRDGKGNRGRTGNNTQRLGS